jgi:putative serine protease PepD
MTDDLTSTPPLWSAPLPATATSTQTLERLPDPAGDGGDDHPYPETPGSADAPGPGRPRRRALALSGALLLAAGAGAGVALGLSGGDGSTPSAAALPTAQTSAAPATFGTTDVKTALSRIKSSVVLVTTKIGSSDPGNGFFGGGFAASGAGTGIVLSGSEVVTNAHVVANASSITVQTPDGQKHSATVEGSDATNDVAVLKVDGVTTMTPAQWAKSSTVQVGDSVIAVGNAEGYGGSPTVSEGIVSALGRSISDQTSSLTGLLQTDAAINPGNSGGPLVDTAGRVIGITTAVERGTSSEPAQGIGFAIPSDKVLSEVPQLRNGQSTTTPAASGAYLGVTLADGPTGPVVQQVGSGTPAAAAGLQTNDVIQRLDSTDVTDSTSLRQAIQQHKPGDKVTLTLVRNNSARQVSVTLGTAPPTTG